MICNQHKLLLLIGMFCQSITHCGLFAQLPVTDIYMFNFIADGSTMQLSTPKQISSFATGHYINQPYFLNASTLLVSCDEDGDNFTDILKLNLDYKSYGEVTATDSISEFSPTICPDRQSLSCVRIEKDGHTQTLWLYPLDQSGYGRRLFPSLSNVGYHSWLNDSLIALFLLNKTHDLHIGNVNTGIENVVLDNIGRCLKTNEKGLLYFVHKTGETMTIKEYNPFTKSLKRIVDTDAEDFDLISDNTILSSNNKSILRICDIATSEWKNVEDLTKYGIGKISRITHTRNKLVIVNTHE